MERIFDALKRAATKFCRFRRAEEGSYLVYVGIAAIPMVAVAGLGVDIARGYLAEARLQAAIDAAAIAMGSADGTDAEIETLGRTFFYANFPNDFWATPSNLNISVTRIDPSDPDSRPSSFNITATARVDTLFFRLLPFAAGGSASAAGQYDYVDVAASSTALTEVKGLEVVMVLDVTGSMYTRYSSGERRIEAMRDAALKMVDILFGDTYEPELLRIGVVPYNTVVNIGKNMHAYVEGTGLDASGAPTTPNPFGQTEWFGCVQARKNDNDLTDAYSETATDGTGRWPAYRWPIEADRNGSEGNIYSSRCETIADNDTGDYRYYEDPLTNFEASESDYWEIYDTSVNPPVLVPSPIGERYYDRNTDGPNKGCPGALLPLTNNRADIWNYLQDVTVVDGNGTITAAGMTWGWRVISPDPPFDQGREYDDIDWEKAIIVLTDGRQVLSTQHTRCDNANKITNPIAAQPPFWSDWYFEPDDYNMDGLRLGHGAANSQQREGPDYRWSAYGYAHPNDSAPLGSGNIQTLLENRFGQVCDAIKAVPDPINGGSAIQIFSITFGDDISYGDSVSTMMANCTTDPLNNYFHAPNTAQLEAAFEEIARQLTSLRLTD